MSYKQTVSERYVYSIFNKMYSIETSVTPKNSGSGIKQIKERAERLKLHLEFIQKG